MPPRLRKNIRSTIQVLSRKGWNNSRIATELNCTRDAVRLWKNRTNPNEKPRRVVKFNQRDALTATRRIESGESVKNVSEYFNVSPSFIYNHIRRNKTNKDGIFPYKTVKGLMITNLQKRKRIEYIKSMPYRRHTSLINKLKSKIYYDQKKLVVGQAPNKQNCRYWSKNKKRRDRIFKSSINPKNIMCLASISYYGKSRLYWFVCYNYQFVKNKRF